MNGQENTGPGDRGASEIVGVVLLFGLVAAGTVIVVMSGGALKEDISKQNRMDSAEVSMKQLDSGMGSLAQQTGDDAVREFRVTDRDSEAVSIVRGDTMTISVADHASCSATVRLDAIRYGMDDERAVTYQAGGVWRTTESGTTIASPPDVDFRNGTLDVAVSHLRGSVDDDFTARKLVTESQQVTSRKEQQLFYSHDDCRRPNGITITVDSRYHEVWAQYFEREMPDGASITHDADMGKVTVELDEMTLRRRADDDRNTVVNFSRANMGSFGDFDGDGGMEVRIDKKGPGSSKNEYHASMTFLGSQAGQSETETKEVPKYEYEIHKHYKNHTHVTWNNTSEKVWVPDNDSDDGGVPMDVLFMLDESGSMNRGGDYGDSRLDKVKEATRDALGTLASRGSEHRAALAGYSSRHGTGFISTKTKVYHDLSHNIGAVRSDVHRLRAAGQTPIGEAIAEPMGKGCPHLPWNECPVKIYDGNNPNREQVIILLSDGYGNDVDWFRNPREMATVANNNNITIHTVGVGNQVNKDLLRDIADRTGGQYNFVSDAEDLNSVFNDLVGGDDPGGGHWEWRNTSEKITTNHKHLEKKHRHKKKVGTKTVVTKRRIVHTPVTLSVQVGAGSTYQPWIDGGSTVDRALNDPYYDDDSRPEGVSIPDDEVVDFEAQVYDCAPGKLAVFKEKKRNGNKWHHAECTKAKSDSIGNPSRMVAFTDGTEVPDDKEPWWQDDMTEMVPDKYLADTDNDGATEFDLDSNQAVVAFRYRDNNNGPHDYNNAVFLMEVGDADGEVTTDWMLNLQVNVVENENN